MKLFSKKKVVYELTPEQKAFLATCHELTRDELRLVNGGGDYGRNGMPSNIPVSASNSEKNESPANASAASGSSSYTGGSKGYNGMPSDVQEKMKNSSGTSGSSSAGSTSPAGATSPSHSSTNNSMTRQNTNPTAMGNYPGKIAGESKTSSSVVVDDSSSEKRYPCGEKDRTESFERITSPFADGMKMQDLKGTPADEDMHGDYKFSQAGCKDTAGAKISSEILGEDISLLDINKADTNEDGLLTQNELKDFIEKKLPEGETIETELLEGSKLNRENLGRIAHPKQGERNYVLLHAIGVGYDKDNALPTETKEDHPHWVVGEGFFINSLNQVQFTYDGTSGNDASRWYYIRDQESYGFSTVARSYILGEPYGFQEKTFFYEITGVEVYTVKTGF